MWKFIKSLFARQCLICRQDVVWIDGMKYMICPNTNDELHVKYREVQSNFQNQRKKLDCDYRFERLKLESTYYAEMTKILEEIRSKK